jgi:hypothetical protein
MQDMYQEKLSRSPKAGNAYALSDPYDQFETESIPPTYEIA